VTAQEHRRTVRDAVERFRSLPRAAVTVRFRIARRLARRKGQKMERIVLAIKLFFKVLFDDAVARRAAESFPELATQRKAAPAKPAAPAWPVAPSAPVAPVSTRSDALTLLSVLQREARLIDFLKEEIGGYADAQIGAAVRDVHRDAAAALERLFALRPLVEQPEGTDIALTTATDTARLRLVGNLGGTPPARGRLQHAGWQATRQDLPQYTGQASSALVIAPAEVEVGG
jgi:hypothetical protein